MRARQPVGVAGWRGTTDFGLWTMSTLWASYWGRIGRDSACFPGHPVFSRAGVRYESHLGLVFSLFRGLWASECAQPVHMRSPSGALFVGAVAVASVLLTYSVDACYLFIVVHGARRDRFLLRKEDFFPPPGLAPVGTPQSRPAGGSPQEPGSRATPGLGYFDGWGCHRRILGFSPV
jgi:hypothetical protein